ncbi:ribose-phosphate diphosphokinase [Amycolatopsis sp. NPDC051903]|uniref:ribose-phosphate diphosphokinase n=1 Tax=Amycolatopsis sp. NPDC051903 TaxID=3363936 RepID=UPI00378CF26A
MTGVEMVKACAVCAGCGTEGFRHHLVAGWLRSVMHAPGDFRTVAGERPEPGSASSGVREVRLGADGEAVDSRRGSRSGVMAELRVVPGTANEPLAGKLTAALGRKCSPCVVERFPDGELRPVVDDARGADVYVVEPTGPEVNEHVVELLLLLDACRRAGAGRVTAVVPYFGYARQDRRGQEGQAVGARVLADALATAGAQRLVVVDPRTAALEAMCAIPVEMVTAVPVLARALPRRPGRGVVVVAPDLGAVKLAGHYASLLDGSVAVVCKHRVSGSRVRAGDVLGTLDDRPMVIVDDMISTGATIEAAVHAFTERVARPDLVVAATHGPLVASAGELLRRLPLQGVLATDSVTPSVPSLTVCSIAPLLADVIGRLHNDQPLTDLLLRT